MNRNTVFSLARWWSIVRKEFLQLRRDRVTFAMIVGVPIIQMALFGYAINTDPKHLDTAIINADNTNITRSFLWGMKNSSYFKFVGELPNEAAGREALDQGKVLFVVTIPAGFTPAACCATSDLRCSSKPTPPTRPQLPMRMFAMNGIVQIGHPERTDRPARASGRSSSALRRATLHRLYNPDGITQYNVVPGLMGVILTLTMVMMTGLAITRERERGTMENLLAMPATPIEVMTGKLIPYIGIGLIQSTIILLAARFVFHVPFFGNVGAIYLVALLFVAANLTVGITLSSLAQNQLQAVQLTVFYFLPNILAVRIHVPFSGHAPDGRSSSATCCP